MVPFFHELILVEIGTVLYDGFTNSMDKKYMKNCLNHKIWTKADYT